MSLANVTNNVLVEIVIVAIMYTVSRYIRLALVMLIVLHIVISTVIGVPWLNVLILYTVFAALLSTYYGKKLKSKIAKILLTSFGISTFLTILIVILAPAFNTNIDGATEVLAITSFILTGINYAIFNSSKKVFKLHS